MLRLLAKNIDIYRISKLLGKKGLKISIAESEIIIDSSRVTNDDINIILNHATIISAQNYYEENQEELTDKGKSEEEEEFPTEELVTENGGVTTTEKNETFEENTTDNPEISNPGHCVDVSSGISESLNKDISIEQKQIELPEFKKICRGEVYSLRPTGEDSEKEVKECVIILQNDYQNAVADEQTIALFCTSCYEERLPIGFSFQLTETNLCDYNRNRLEKFSRKTLFASRIKGINKSDLGRYLGSMNTSFMNTLQPTIDFCLGLKRNRNINWAQLQMLFSVKMEDLYRIAESKVNDREKVEEILQLFGFDINSKNVDYIKRAILIAHKLNDYNLEYLAHKIAKEEQLTDEEVVKIIVDTIKEKFNLKKSMAISFIRLAEVLLKKG